jgi:RNA polymerase sigma factor (sigma-70 family)
MVHKPKSVLEAHLFVIAGSNGLRQKNDEIAAPSKADDLFQDACLRVLKLKEPQTVREPQRYILGIIRNLFIDGRRKQRRAEALFVDTAKAAEIPDDQPSAEQVLAGKELLSHVMAEIDKLPARCREAFVMHRFDNLTYPAIAREMGVSIGTVEKHIAQAMARLANAMRPKPD